MLANELIKQNPKRQFLAKETKMQSEYLDDWHCHPWHQVIFPISGLLQSSINNKNYIVPHNGFLFIPAGHQHKSIAITNTHFLAIYLNPKNIIDCLEENNSGLVKPFLKNLMLLLSKPNTANLEEKVITNLLAVFQDQIKAADNYDIPLLIPKDRRLSAIFLQLQKQPNLTLTLSEWALQVGASPRTLSRICAKEFGLSFSLWRQNLRLVLSLALLETNKLQQRKSILEVALDLGYQSDSAYIYAFKGLFLQTPSQYRRDNLRLMD